jgi:hypothetical protein
MPSRWLRPSLALRACAPSTLKRSTARRPRNAKTELISRERSTTPGVSGAGRCPTCQRAPASGFDVHRTAGRLRDEDPRSERCNDEIRGPMQPAKHSPSEKVSLALTKSERRTVLDEEGFQRLFAAAEEALRPVLLVAFATRQVSAWSEKPSGEGTPAARPASGSTRPAPRYLDAFELQDVEWSLRAPPPPRERRAHAAARGCAWPR